MKKEIAAALRTLRDSGINIPRKFISRATREMPAVKHGDVRKFRAYCERAWKEQTRFVVGWGGAWGSAKHLTFHTVAGLQGRQKHMKDLHRAALGAFGGGDTAPSDNLPGTK